MASAAAAAMAGRPVDESVRSVEPRNSFDDAFISSVNEGPPPPPPPPSPPPAAVHAPFGLGAGFDDSTHGSLDDDSMAAVSHGGGGGAAAAPVVAAQVPAELPGIYVPRGGGAGCPLCWEEQLMLREARDAEEAAMEAAAARREGASAVRHAKSAMLKRAQNYSKLIFDFERSLVGHQADETIFLGMLELRRAVVERILDEHKIAYTPWTLGMIRRHYDVRNNHRYDPIRELKYLIERTRVMEESMLQGGMYRPDPAGAGPPVFDMKMSAAWISAARQHQVLLKSLNDELRASAREAAAEASRQRLLSVMSTLNLGDARGQMVAINALAQAGGGAAGGGGGGGGEAVQNAALVEDMYSIGGL
jgi:hypothetical protein